MKLGVLAGNRSFPLFFIKNAKEYDRNLEIVAICFRGETNPSIKRFADKVYWINVGELKNLLEILKKEDIKHCVMAGQINPLRIFKKRRWDSTISNLVKDIDWRPHSVFGKIIEFLEAQGVKFLNSTIYVKHLLADEGIMNGVSLSEDIKRDIEFGMDIIFRYVELDVGQTLVVKNKAVVSLEGLEGTDNTIKRAYKICRGNFVVFKFAKKDQDLRFDVPVVGLSTLSILKKTGAKALVLESGKVLILDKDKFLNDAYRAKIAVVGKRRVN